MAHSCPECGMWCHCGGDIDDIECRTAEWVYKNCDCCDGEGGCEYCGAGPGQDCEPDCSWDGADYREDDA